MKANIILRDKKHAKRVIKKLKAMGFKDDEEWNKWQIESLKDYLNHTFVANVDDADVHTKGFQIHSHDCDVREAYHFKTVKEFKQYLKSINYEIPKKIH